LNQLFGRVSRWRVILALGLVLINAAAVWSLRERVRAKVEAQIAQAALTQAQAQNLALSSDERQFEDISFRFSWDEAMAEARALHRPVLLVTFDGDLYGRC
jgi:hypothetical protein